MEENMTVEMEDIKVDDTFEAPIEVESSFEPTSASSNSGSGLADVVSGAIIGLAGYGIYRIGKDIVVPGAKKVWNWGKSKKKSHDEDKSVNKKGAKKKAAKKEIVDAEFEDIEDTEE